MQDVIFSLSISSESYLKYYQGTVNAVIVRAEDGRKIQFPAEALRPFIKPNGIKGRFRLVYDQAHKFRKLEQLAG